MLPAWTARASSSHLYKYVSCAASGTQWKHTPEIVFRISRYDVIFLDALVEPVLTSFKIWLEACFGIALEVSDVEAVLRKFIHVGQNLPRVLDGFFL
jgi:hypothetical protein